MIEQKYETVWYNFKKNEYDYLSETPQNFSEYIPQNQAAQGLYSLLTEDMGYSPIKAAMRVLELSAGIAK